MGFRDRIAAEAAKVQGKVRDELTEMVAGPDGSTSIEGFLLGLVRQARNEEQEEEVSEKEVRKSARKRRRRLGIASFAAGPFAGVAGEVSDLYSETATVCDVVDLHDLPLTDLDIGAHMLVLWNVTESFDAAKAALDGSGPSIMGLLVIGNSQKVSEADTVIKKIKLLWGARGAVGDAREAMTSGAFKRVLRAGSQSKDFLQRAEEQLGV